MQKLFPLPACRSCKNGAKIEKIMNNMTSLSENTFSPASEDCGTAAGLKPGPAPHRLSQMTTCQCRHLM